nr:MAG TPA: terminase large subunit [Caudoviricetes sp.]
MMIQTQELRKVKAIIKRVFANWKCPPKLTISEWADAKRYLSPEASAEPGKYKTSRAEYQRGIMDAFSDPMTQRIVVMSSAQVGKTEILNNIVGYYIDQDPSTILNLQPTVEMAETWSKDRLAPMVRDNPCLTDKVKDSKAKNSGNTILHKLYPGGHITIVGANSPAGLASRPIRIVLCDEVDRYPISAGAEGDPVNLAIKRTTTFWNKKIGLFSTPTIKNLSRIEKAFEESDQRYFMIPCPHCGTFQRLVWGQVKFSKDDVKNSYYECEHCGSALNDSDRVRAISKGHWEATQPFNGIAGFHLNELNSPWRKLSEIVQDFINNKDDPETLKTWVNTCLGETWEDAGETLEPSALESRVENYTKIPKGALILTAGVDTQDDRLECEITAWGKNEESWLVDYVRIYGDPDQPEVWQQLDDLLAKTYTHESGAKMSISATCIDTGGHKTQSVYEYGRTRYMQNVFLIKGVGGENIPIIGAQSKVKCGKSKRTVKLFPLGVDQAKGTIYGRLKINEFGAGYMHFPKICDRTYFDSLTAEKLVTKYNKGFAKRTWVKIRARNEALDCRVYSYAALKIKNPNFDKLTERMTNNEIKSKIEALKAKFNKNNVEMQDGTKAKKEDVALKMRKQKKRVTATASNFAINWRG